MGESFVINGLQCVKGKYRGSSSFRLSPPRRRTGAMAAPRGRPLHDPLPPHEPIPRRAAGLEGKRGGGLGHGARLSGAGGARRMVGNRMRIIAEVSLFRKNLLRSDGGGRRRRLAAASGPPSPQVCEFELGVEQLARNPTNSYQASKSLRSLPDRLLRVPQIRLLENALKSIVRNERATFRHCAALKNGKHRPNNFTANLFAPGNRSNYV